VGSQPAVTVAFHSARTAFRPRGEPSAPTRVTFLPSRSFHENQLAAAAATLTSRPAGMRQKTRLGAEHGEAIRPREQS
jgi:hypothetical protein